VKTAAWTITLLAFACGMLLGATMAGGKADRIAAPQTLAAVQNRPETPAVETGRPSRSAKPRVVEMTVTAYCPCRKCCGKHADGVTASGRSVKTNGGRFVAADTRVLPMFTKVAIPGYNGGKAVPVLDVGGAIKGNRLDVFFATHQQARNWGVRKLKVTVE